MQFLLTAQAVDHPGIVATVSGAIADKGWSIDDASMTRLAGRFAMLLMVSADDVDVDRVSSLLRPALDEANVGFRVEEITATEEREVAGQRWTVTVYGADRPGIVAAVTRKLADWNVNIDDLSTRVSEHGTTYTMLIDATVPLSVDGQQFSAALSDVGESLGVTCRAMPVDVDVL